MLCYDCVVLCYDCVVLCYDWVVLCYDWVVLCYDCVVLCYDWVVLCYDWVVLYYDCVVRRSVVHYHVEWRCVRLRLCCVANGVMMCCSVLGSVALSECLFLFSIRPTYFLY